MGRGASSRSKPAKPKPKRRKKRGGLSDKKGTKGRGTSGKNYEQEQPPADSSDTEEEPEPDLTVLVDDHEEKCEELKTNSGRSRGYWEVMTYLYSVHKLVQAVADGSMQRLIDATAKEEVLAHLLDKRPNMTPFVRMAGKLIGMDAKVCHEVYKTYWDESAVLVNENKRGLGADSVNLEDSRQLKGVHLASIESFIAKCHGARGGGRATLRTIRNHLLDEFSSENLRTRDDKRLLLTEIKPSAIRYALVHWLGYAWGKVKLRKIQGSADRPKIVRTYLHEKSKALKLERDGTHVIVYTDESYCHQTHAPSESWIKEGSGGRVDRGSSKGKRLIIL